MADPYEAGPRMAGGKQELAEGVSPIMENQMEKKMENGMETARYRVI